jgi:murein endopeptidase
MTAVISVSREEPPSAASLTKLLTKQAKYQDLTKLHMLPNLQQRRCMFNTFMDDLRVILSISPWTMHVHVHVLDNWP